MNVTFVLDQIFLIENYTNISVYSGSYIHKILNPYFFSGKNNQIILKYIDSAESELDINQTNYNLFYNS